MQEHGTLIYLPLRFNFRDYSGRGYHGVPSASTIFVDRLHFPAAKFDGADVGQRVTITGLSATSVKGITIQFTFYPTGGYSGRSILSWALTPGSSEPWIMLRRDATSVVAYVNSGYNLTFSGINDDTKYVIALTCDGTTWKGYVNGLLVSSYTGGITGYQAYASNLYIGAAFNDITSCWISEFSAHSFAMPSSLVMQNYNKLVKEKSNV